MINKVTMNNMIVQGIVAGRDIVINGNKVLIDGKDFTPEGNPPIINITIEGDCDNVSNASGTVTIKGNCNSVKTASGDVDVKESVNGNVKTVSGDVKANIIKGNVETVSGDITYKSKA